MQLTYRGVSYSYNPTQLAATKKENTLKFRGCEYQPSKLVINTQKVSQSEQLTYRGISVVHGQSRRFLGQTYQKRSFVFS
jgi:hypothetical protein